MIFSQKKNNNELVDPEMSRQTVNGKGKLIVSYVLQITCLFWMVTKMIGWRLWTTERLLPLAPPFDFLTAPDAVHWILLAASFVLMLLLMLKPATKILLIALFISELLSCLFDQSRWQPWEYQFVFTLLVYIINYNQPKKIIAGLAFLMVSTYAYSGLGKFNQSFLILFWDNLFLRQYLKLSPAFIHQSYIYYGGYLLAMIEMLFGIGLLFRSIQKLSAWLIIAMHIFIVILVGPFGLKYNIVVWPWNILMILQLYFVFIYTDEAAVNIKLLWKGWNKMILIFWGLLPALNHTAGWWDNFLSSRLFAGNQPQMMFCIKDSSEIKQLQPYIYKNNSVTICDSNAVMVNLQMWAMKEMKSPPYTEERVYKKIAKKWISEHPGTSTKAILYYYINKGEIKIKPYQ
jgi:hypothetical protein